MKGSRPFLTEHLHLAAVRLLLLLLRLLLLSAASNELASTRLLAVAPSMSPLLTRCLPLALSPYSAAAPYCSCEHPPRPDTPHPLDPRLQVLPKLPESEKFLRISSYSFTLRPASCSMIMTTNNVSQMQCDGPLSIVLSSCCHLPLPNQPGCQDVSTAQQLPYAAKTCEEQAHTAGTIHQAAV